MHGHTGFLITTRRLAPGVTPPLRKRRPAKGNRPEDLGGDAEWSPEDIGERVPSDKRVRKLARSMGGTSTSP